MAEEIREFIVDINTFQDIEVYFDRLTKGENVKLGNIAENITVAIKLDGGRFTNYEAPYVNQVIANMVIAHQESYKRIIKILEKDYNITDLDSELLLQFKLEEGCCEAELKQINIFMENMKDMTPEIQVAIIGALLLGLFGVGAYKLIKQRMQNNKEIAIRRTELEKETLSTNKEIELAKEHNRNVEAVISEIGKIVSDVKLEKAVNYSKEKTLKYLNVDENLSYQADDGRRSEQVTKNQIDEYEVNTPEQTIQENEIIENIIINVANMSYGPGEKMVKTVGNSQLFNRDTLTVQDRITLERKADNNEPVNVEVKFIKDQNDKILRAYLLRIVD